MESKIKEARKAAGLTQQGMSEKLEIPKRNIENWETGKNKCPDWAEKLIVEKLEGMKMRSVYNLTKESVEVNIKNKAKIAAGITTTYKDDHFPEVIKEFDNLDDALDALKAYKTKVTYYPSAVSYYMVEEFYVEEVKLDADDEFVESDIWKFSEMPEFE